ncbi:MAG: FkbM family methyltransferase [Mojavia pulchra JT2-VF2]|jgi:FkbM family methyltransferase|uniref:FkbM family methyltransferase n=1 Tax=Mojavia pulchra JT2-VF2 TaxID=287848 RepID=A0A951PWR3_9NOST|nr:FkbM family methyltransferase [Mojavia pulchra JT2-VF2]
MQFPSNDQYWINAAIFLQNNLKKEDKLIAPNEFAEKFQFTRPYSSIGSNSLDECQWFVIHKGMMETIGYTFLKNIVNKFIPVFANEVFVIFSQQSDLPALKSDFIHIKSFLEKMPLLEKIPNKSLLNSQNNGVKEAFFSDIKDIVSWNRTDLELFCRKMSQTAYLGDGIILSRVLTKYMCYLEAQDLSLTPHLCLNGYWESWITQVMIQQLLPGNYCLDIGANCGYYSLIMADVVGTTGNVVAVEPNPRLASLLEKSLNVNGFSKHTRVVQKAVADTNGNKVNLVIPKEGFWGSSTISQSEILPGEQAFEVETVTVDELTKDWPQVDLIKIDAEGAEKAIWNGMRETIKKNNNIIIIMEFCCYRDYNPKEFLHEIQAAGFSIKYIDNDSQIKSLSIEDCLAEKYGEYWDLFLQRDN